MNNKNNLKLDEIIINIFTLLNKEEEIRNEINNSFKYIINIII